MKVVRNFIPDFDAHGHLYLLTTCDKGTTLRNTLGYNYNDNIIKNQNHFQVLLPALPSRFDSCNCYWGGLKKLGCPSWWWVGFPFISMIKRRERKGRESQREREGGREGASGREKGGLGEVPYNGSTYCKSNPMDFKQFRCTWKLSASI